MLDSEAFAARFRMHAHAKARVPSPVSIWRRYLQTPAPKSPTPSSSSASLCSWQFIFVLQSSQTFTRTWKKDQTLQLHFITFYKTDKFLFWGLVGGKNKDTRSIFLSTLLSVTAATHRVCTSSCHDWLAVVRGVRLDCAQLPPRVYKISIPLLSRESLHRDVWSILPPVVRLHPAWWLGVHCNWTELIRSLTGHVHMHSCGLSQDSSVVRWFCSERKWVESHAHIWWKWKGMRPFACSPA